MSGDLDGDRDADLVVASADDNSISWYENLDGRGTYGFSRLITTQALGASAFYLADLDGDLDLDVLSASAATYDSDVSWYPNDGRGQFGAQRVISAEVDLAQTVVAADVDGDGDIDVVSASSADDKVAWYENADGHGKFERQSIVSDHAGGATGVYATDVDGDHDVDIVAGLYDDNMVVWYENQDGTGDRFAEHLLTATAKGVTTVYAADLDGDGRIDIVSTSRSDNTISWFPNGGAAGFGVERVLSADVAEPEGFHIGDIDGDQRLDVAVVSRASGNVVWLENQGDGVFSRPQIVGDHLKVPSSVWLIDVDGDRDLDLFSCSRNDNQVIRWKNLDGRGTFGSEQLLSNVGLAGVSSARLSDLDGDQDLDLLATAQDGDLIVWLENIDGAGTFGRERLITDRVRGPRAVAAGDLDGDGDQDVVSVSADDRKLSWYVNRDGRGDFGPQRVISADSENPWNVALADLDGDRDLDIIMVSRSDNQISWFTNLDGRGTFGPQEIISISQIEPTEIEPVDIDGDGDIDLVANGYAPYTSSVAWYENQDGQGTFGGMRTIATNLNIAAGIAVGDLDGDRDVDVLMASALDDRLIWSPNTNGKGVFARGRELAGAIDGVFALDLADLDSDGDLDVIALGLLDGSVSWFENRNGQGDFSERRLVVSGLGGPIQVLADDLDRDRDPDLVLVTTNWDQLLWLRNLDRTVQIPGDFNGDGEVDIVDVDLLRGAIARGDGDVRWDFDGDDSIDVDDLGFLVREVLQTDFGDTNLDGLFDSRDLVAVFTAGGYEDNVVGNTTWASGDWNADNEFTSSDLVLALQQGTYSANAMAAVSEGFGHSLAVSRFELLRFVDLDGVTTLRKSRRSRFG